MCRAARPEKILVEAIVIHPPLQRPCPAALTTVTLERCKIFDQTCGVFRQNVHVAADRLARQFPEDVQDLIVRQHLTDDMAVVRLSQDGAPVKRRALLRRKRNEMAMDHRKRSKSIES